MIDTEMFMVFIENVLEVEDYTVADKANKIALELKQISVDTYLAAARRIVKAMLEID